jgi:fructose-1,6-bisphosphatase II
MSDRFDERFFAAAPAEALLAVTEAAAIAQTAPHLESEGLRLEAAIEAMHESLLANGLRGRLVAGKGLGLKLGRLYTGERLGSGPRGTLDLPALDLAVDPVEGTSFAGEGGEALAVLAATTEGAFLDPGPGFYMEKLVAPPAAAGRLDPARPLAGRLADLAAALDKPVRQLTVAVLEKPRHRILVEQLRAAGVQVRLTPAGDVALALQALLPEEPLDALMGTGGFAEGLMAAAAARALGGAFYGRFDPQLQSERMTLAKAGIDTRRWYGLDELVRAPQTLFLATGIRAGWLGGVERGPGWLRTSSFALTGPGGERMRVTRVRPWREAA